MINHPLFKNVELKHLQKQLHITNFPKGTLLFQEGEECNSLGIVLSGEISISTLTIFDKEYTINVLGKNDIFGDNLLFNNDNKFLGDGIVTKDVAIVYIPKEILLELLENKVFLINYLNIVTEKNMLVRQRLKLLSQKSLEDKIMFYLTNEYKKNNSKTIKIKSKEDLANKLNVPRPSLSRELINLKKKGLINYNRYFITLMI